MCVFLGVFGGRIYFVCVLSCALLPLRLFARACVLDLLCAIAGVCARRGELGLRRRGKRMESIENVFRSHDRLGVCEVCLSLVRATVAVLC